MTPTKPERRRSQRVNVAMCEDGHVVEATGDPYDIWEIRCPRGHWTDEAGNYCGACGAKLR